MKNLMDRDSLLKRNKIKPFRSNRALICEKDHGVTVSKVVEPALTPRKVILGIWWDGKEIIHYEMLQPVRRFDSTLHCQQLIRLQQVTDKKRPI